MITMSLTPEQELEMYADIKVIKDKLERDFTCLDDHEKRIKKLESSYSWFAGAVAVAGAVAGAVVSFFINMFLK